jgi:hypothetical protein
MQTFILKTGTWTNYFYGGAVAHDNFEAGPVIVPSGLYAADTAGYVYALRPLYFGHAIGRGVPARPGRTSLH